MTIIKIFIPAFILFILMACNEGNQSIQKKVVVEKVSFESSEDDMEPPPPNFVFKDQTLQGWFTALCNNKQPEKPISEYNIALFELKDHYVLSLAGTNTYNIDKTHAETHNDYIPSNAYFKIPASFYENLNRDALLNKLALELSAFTKTPTFKSSFLAKSDKIVFQTTGKIIWTK